MTAKQLDGPVARSHAAARLFRLWIARYANWRPQGWSDTPPEATVLQPVDDAVYSAEEAAVFLQGFNSEILGHEPSLWAVAVPVTLVYQGDVQAGQIVQGHVFER